jgi:circadian clock protein KaiB
MKTKTVKRRAPWSKQQFIVGAHDHTYSTGRASGSHRRSAQLWQLRLYVTGQTSKSLTAFSNLKKFCESHLKGRYRITVIDLMKRPQLAKGDQILAIPTVVRKLPNPVRTIIGNLSDTERVLVGLDLRPAD